MFELFGKHRNGKTFLGVDFGTSYIKVVELGLEKDTPKLINYGQVELAFTQGKTSFKFYSPEEKMRVYLGGLLRRMGTESGSACVSLPAFAGLITRIEMPAMSNEELEQAIRFEAPKHIPVDLKDVTLSWEVFDSTENRLKVLLVAALNKDVERYESYINIKGSNLSLELLELEIFSLIRAVIDDDTQNWIVIDIGSRATNILVVEHGLVSMNHNINMGGNEMTNTLAESLKVEWVRADQLKRGTVNYLTNRDSMIVFPTLEMIRYETSRILESLQSREAGSSIQGIVLSGGSSKMVGLREYFERAFQLPVAVADPWKKVIVDERLRKKLDQYGSSFSSAIGLALGGLESIRQKKE